MAGVTNYIFCINTGRSGSGYLNTLFDHARECRAFHEPSPIGNKRPMRLFLRGNGKSARDVAQKKCLKIRELRCDCRVYVETNHCFIKGFGWFVPEFISEKRIGVIILTRNKSEIVNSLTGVRCSPLSRDGRNWLALPTLKNPLSAPPAPWGPAGRSYRLARLRSFPWRSMDFLAHKLFKKDLAPPRWLANYQRECLEWYVDETASRAAAFRERFPGIKYYTVDIANLNSADSVKAMFGYFGLEPKDSLADVVGQPVNRKRAA